MELDSWYADVICSRYQEYTGKSAMLDGDGRTFAEIPQERRREAVRIERGRAEIAAIEAQIRARHPDLQGLCRGLADWSAERRLLRGLAE